MPASKSRIYPGCQQILYLYNFYMYAQCFFCEFGMRTYNDFNFINKNMHKVCFNKRETMWQHRQQIELVPCVMPRSGLHFANSFKFACAANRSQDTSSPLPVTVCALIGFATEAHQTHFRHILTTCWKEQWNYSFLLDLSPGNGYHKENPNNNERVYKKS